MIFYFSCTGNTLWAAEMLSRTTGEKLVNMADQAAAETEWSLIDGERIGFCFPVHGWRPPKTVRQFVKRMKVKTEKETFCYSVCTAGDTVGEAIDIMKSDLAARGLTLESAYSLLMPNTYVGLPFMNVDPDSVAERKIKQAAADIEHIAQAIIERRSGVFNVTRGRWPRINSRFLGALFIKYLVTDTPFHVDESHCNKCGKCAAVCPTGNITAGCGASPQWHRDGSCLACFACYHHCPRHCINYGSRTKHKGQYFFKGERVKR